MKTCPNQNCKATDIPDDAKFCPNCGAKLSISPSCMPAEVDVDDEFLVCNNWRYTFWYLVNDKYQRYTGRIFNTKRGATPSFIIICKEDGYIRDVTIFHTNGNIAVHWKLGTYLQYPSDNENVIEHEEYYSETGQPISRETFGSIYESLIDNFDTQLVKKEVDDALLKS